MVQITIDIRHDKIDKGTHIEYKPEFLILVDEEEKILETKIYNFIKELLGVDYGYRRKNKRYKRKSK